MAHNGVFVKHFLILWRIEIPWITKPRRQDGNRGLLQCPRHVIHSGESGLSFNEVKIFNLPARPIILRHTLEVAVARPAVLLKAHGLFVIEEIIQRLNWSVVEVKIEPPVDVHDVKSDNV